jgi:hypothetical protein
VFQPALTDVVYALSQHSKPAKSTPLLLPFTIKLLSMLKAGQLVVLQPKPQPVQVLPCWEVLVCLEKEHQSADNSPI